MRCWLSCLLVMLVALPARAQSVAPSRFEGPELGAAAHLRLTPDRIHDAALSGAVSLLGAPVSWLVLETGLDGLDGDIATTRTWFALSRVRLARVGRAAAGLGVGVEWNAVDFARVQRADGEVAPATFWSVPLEASIEVRPVAGLTVRPYLGLRLPLPGFDCSNVEAGPTCRIRPSLYLGASIGWAYQFLRAPQPAE